MLILEIFFRDVLEDFSLELDCCQTNFLFQNLLARLNIENFQYTNLMGISVKFAIAAISCFIPQQFCD